MIVKTIKETERFANNFAKKVTIPTILALSGELGSGKTTFTKFLAKSLGIKENVNSPTFNIITSYQPMTDNTKGDKPPVTSFKFFHIDCYRLNEPEKLLDLGLSDILKDKNNIIVIEWADKIKKFLPKNTIWIEFKHIENDKREILIN
ncbi:MAG: tRNA (adenosine(37)-N6)-threonylcarbamoyltransferase complex ATPase subunit type 1 TsaE [Patescibacteria group bacterium]